MSSGYIALGIPLFAITVLFFGVKYFRSRRPHVFPKRGWVGLAIILASEILLFGGVEWVGIFFTPLAWTGYILLVDAMVRSLRGRSRLEQDPREFFTLASWSFVLWLTFEAYNIRLQNWIYVGLTDNMLVLIVGGIWAFSTIWPAIFETADLVQALGFFHEQGRYRLTLSPTTHFIIFLVGLLFVTVPVLLSPSIGSYLFGAVWVGFVFLLDPLNYRWKGYSLLREWEQGRTTATCCFMLAGLVCGTFWEFWNYWAASKWLYVFPIGQGSKIFEMPLPGYLGFPAFALECLVMYEFVQSVRKRLLRFRHKPEWAVAGPQSSGS